MKTVVDAGLDMQKYNPEVKPSTNLQNVDSRVANLADKLRHVHQVSATLIYIFSGCILIFFFYCRW